MGNSYSCFSSCPGGWQNPVNYRNPMAWLCCGLFRSSPQAAWRFSLPAPADAAICEPAQVAVILQSPGFTHQGPEHGEDPWCSHNQEPPQGLRVVVLHHLNDPEQGLHPRPPQVPHVEPFQVHQARPGSKINRQKKICQNFRGWWLLSSGSTVTPQPVQDPGRPTRGTNSSNKSTSPLNGPESM